MSYRRKDKPKISIRQTNKPFKGISLEKKKVEIKKDQAEEKTPQNEGWEEVKRKLRKLKRRFSK